MRRSQGFELLLVIGQLLLQGGKLLHQLPKHLLAQGRELVLFGLKLADHGLTKLRHSFGYHNAILVHQPVHFIHQSRPLAHKPLAHAMQRLDVLLVDVLDRHKAHGRTRHRFRDGLGIAAVVFVRLDVRLDELRGHELHFMAIRPEASRPIMCAATGFDADAYRGQLGDTGHQVMPRQALAIHDVAPVIHPHGVKHTLCDIDPEDVYLVLHGTRLLWLNRFTDRELIVAHCRRSAQGRVHFITTLVWELRGISCLPLALCPPPKQSLMVSRSFGRPITTLIEMREAVATYMTRTAEKLRRHNVAAGVLTVFLMTNRYTDEPQYSNSVTMPLPVATQDTAELIRYALRGVERIYREGYRYQKAGVILTALVPAHQIQAHLFDDHDREHSQKLMTAIDTINREWGSGTIRYAAVGLRPGWLMRCARRSPRYTTRWEELAVVR